jgi:hypothetical protein
MAVKLTQEALKAEVHYDPHTGIFTRAKSNNLKVRVGDVAGWTSKEGYICMRIQGKGYKAHRLAWLYMTGETPDKYLDHINRVKSDNRWDNLRLATASQNRINTDIRIDNSCSAVGVSKVSNANRYIARGQLHGERVYLGCFKTIAEASLAYTTFAKTHYGEYYNGL